MSVPSWVKHAVFYQVFPDRFARSNRSKARSDISFLPWESAPAQTGFMGGDLWGVVEKLPYLEKLGVNALYLNPIFASAANHRYHTYDYYNVDPILGGNEALRMLLDEAHERGILIVLDGVFNHASRGFWPFHHVLENGAASPYVDWFYIDDWPLRPYNSSKSEPHNYGAWWNLPALPKLNTGNPAVRQFIFDVAEYWINFGIDGWRLDVPTEIKEVDFWPTFRERVKSANPEAYLCGEIWDDAPEWVSGDRFDATMNYQITWPILSFFGARTLRPDYKRNHLLLEPLDAAGFARQIEHVQSLYHPDTAQVQLNLLGSHDMARPLWIIGDNSRAMQQAILCLMTLPGAPCVYYGDEIGLSAGDDPHCRGAFPWGQEDSWNLDILRAFRRSIGLRRTVEVLRTGDYRTLFAEGNVVVYRRSSGKSEVFVAFNSGSTAAEISINVDGEDRTLVDVWVPENAEMFDVRKNLLSLRLPPREARVLMDKNAAR